MTTTLTPTAPTAAPATDAAVRTFRGRTLEELLPQIRAELGPDAVVVRQREGLMGGVGGFFQQRFVEVDACAGAAEPRPRIDVYDAEPETFAQLLAQVAEEGGPRLGPGGTGSDPRSSILDALVEGGLGRQFAERLIADAEAHELPFTDGDLRAAVRRALSRRLPTALPHRARGLAVAFAGPGSTACASALAAAYAKAGRRADAVASLDEARRRIERGADDAVIAVDLPALAAPEQVATLELDELLVVVPAASVIADMAALQTRLAPTGLALSLDDDAQPGAAIELACTTRLPIAYVLDDATGAIAPADPTALAERLLP